VTFKIPGLGPLKEDHILFVLGPVTWHI